MGAPQPRIYIERFLLSAHDHRWPKAILDPKFRGDSQLAVVLFARELGAEGMLKDGFEISQDGSGATPLMRGIKKVFDPNGILSPGRYEFGKVGRAEEHVVDRG